MPMDEFKIVSDQDIPQNSRTLDVERVPETNRGHLHNYWKILLF